VIDAFEAAAGQVKADTEGEQRIAGSYQVCKHFTADERVWQGSAVHGAVEVHSSVRAWRTSSRHLQLAVSDCQQPRRLLLQGLYAKMVEAFKKMGLEVVPGVGTPFDPEVGWKRFQAVIIWPLCAVSLTESELTPLVDTWITSPRQHLGMVFAQLWRQKSQSHAFKPPGIGHAGCCRQGAQAC
jgi:hypothetical protein